MHTLSLHFILFNYLFLFHHSLLYSWWTDCQITTAIKTNAKQKWNQVLTLKLLEKTKQWNQNYKTCHFCTRKCQTSGSSVIIKVFLRYEKTVAFTFLWVPAICINFVPLHKFCAIYINFWKNLRNNSRENFVFLHFCTQKCLNFFKIQTSYSVQFQKNIKNRFRENVKKRWFWVQKGPIFTILSIWIFLQNPNQSFLPNH